MVYPEITALIKCLVDRLGLTDISSRRENYYEDIVGRARKGLDNIKMMKRMDAHFERQVMQ